RLFRYPHLLAERVQPDSRPVSLRSPVRSGRFALRQRQRSAVPVPVRDGRARRPSLLRRPDMARIKLHTRLTALAAASALWMTLVAPWAAAAGTLQVMTATTDLAALAQEVGGDKVEVESVARGYQDPHFVEAKPSFLLKLRRADLLIVVGLELEIGWLPPLITQSTNPRIQVGAP